MKTLIRVYTDGACFPNPGRGGWAWVTKSGHHGYGHDPQTTNNIMELRGAIEAIKALAKYRLPLIVVSDSQYVVKGGNLWMTKWEKKGWVVKKKNTVKNLELWKELYALKNEHSVLFEWVRGHCGHPENEEADRLANLASHNLK